MKLKYYIPTSPRHLLHKIAVYIAFMGHRISGVKSMSSSISPRHLLYKFVANIAFMAILINGVQAMPPPESYGENQCQRIALDYQEKHGGSLIWIQPIDNVGNPILSEYGAHVINKVYDPIERKLFYIDYKLSMRLNANEEIKLWNNKPVKVYDLSKDRPEFGLIWHY